MSFLKKWWPEIVVFGIVLAALLICNSPNYTWINTNSDGIHFTFSAKYLYPAHKASEPPYLLLGWLFIHTIPIFTDTWRMALISVFSGIGSCIFIYLIIKHFTIGNKYSRLIGIVGALIYGGAALPFSQNIIVEVYPLEVMVFLAGFYFAVKKRWVCTSLMIGLSGAIHPLAIMFIIPMLIGFKELRNWKYIGIIASFLIFYLYIPLTNRAPYMWHQPNGSGGIFGFIRDTVSTAGMLSGGLAIWDFPKRVLDVASQLILCWGIGIIGLMVYFWKSDKKYWKMILFWLVILPIVYYAIDLAPQTSVYMQSSIAFGAVIIGIGLSKIRKEWVFAALVFSVIMLGINTNYFDVGRTLDPNLSATEFYYKELPKVGDNQILLTKQGWEWAAVFKYNKENDINIIPVFAGTLPSPVYRQQLIDAGVKFQNIDTDQHAYTNNEIINSVLGSILDENNNMMMTVTTNAATYGTKVVPIVDKSDAVDNLYVPELKIEHPEWKWKPSNPYDIITGSIEVKEWINVLWSNYNILTFVMLGCIGYVPVWVLWQMFIKKKKWSLSKDKKVMKDVSHIQ